MEPDVQAIRTCSLLASLGVALAAPSTIPGKAQTSGADRVGGLVGVELVKEAWGTTHGYQQTARV